METKTARLSLTMSCILMCGMGLLGASAARATGYTFGATTGNWNVGTNWSPNGIPGSADGVTINGGDNVTVNDTEAASGLQIDNSGTAGGTLTITTGGNLTLGTSVLVAEATGASGSLVMNGGTYTSTAGLFVGYGAGATGSFQISGGSYTAGGLAIGSQTATSLGTMSQSGGTASVTSMTIGKTGGTASSYSISGGTLHWSTVTNLTSGSYAVRGSSALISYNGTGGAASLGFNAAAGTTLSFAFDAAGVSAINLNNTEFSIGTGALLTIDGSSYAGGTSNITLVSGISSFISGGTHFSPTISGFGTNYTEQLVYNTNSIVLQVTQVPEPGTVAFLLIGGGVVCFVGRRRFPAASRRHGPIGGSEPIFLWLPRPWKVRSVFEAAFRS